eukprot:Hpha_TRINITY_DN16700_c3_g1::TRINITY_DN16700_c3_g1_i1::g.79154::m.79154
MSATSMSGGGMMAQTVLAEPVPGRAVVRAATPLAARPVVRDAHPVHFVYSVSEDEVFSYSEPMYLPRSLQLFMNSVACRYPPPRGSDLSADLRGAIWRQHIWALGSGAEITKISYRSNDDTAGLIALLRERILRLSRLEGSEWDEAAGGVEEPSVPEMSIMDDEAYQILKSLPITAVTVNIRIKVSAPAQDGWIATVLFDDPARYNRLTARSVPGRRMLGTEGLRKQLSLNFQRVLRDIVALVENGDRRQTANQANQANQEPD